MIEDKKDLLDCISKIKNKEEGWEECFDILFFSELRGIIFSCSNRIINNTSRRILENYFFSTTQIYKNWRAEIKKAIENEVYIKLKFQIIEKEGDFWKQLLKYDPTHPKKAKLSSYCYRTISKIINKLIDTEKENLPVSDDSEKIIHGPKKKKVPRDRYFIPFSELEWNYPDSNKNLYDRKDEDTEAESERDKKNSKFLKAIIDLILEQEGKYKKFLIIYVSQFFSHDLLEFYKKSLVNYLPQNSSQDFLGHEVIDNEIARRVGVSRRQILRYKEKLKPQLKKLLKQLYQ